MKVLDPQSALLTTSEVRDFLLHNPPRAPPRHIGSYTPVNLKGYQRIRDDFAEYISSTTPYIAEYPPPGTFVKNLVPKLKAYGLTKPEVYMMLNLGIGIARGGQPQQQEQISANGSRAVNGDAVETVEEETTNGDNEEGEPSTEAAQLEDSYQPSDLELLACVIEDLDDRFPGEEGQEQLQVILETIRGEYDKAHAAHASTNGNATVADGDDDMDVS